MEREGFDARIDHRSYERQGVDKVPSIHLSAAVSQMERKGIIIDRGNINREIADINKEIRQTKARIRKIKTWIYSQPLENPPTMVDTINNVAKGKNLNYRWQRIRDLQIRARVLVFIQNNDIRDMEQLANKVQQMYEQEYEVSKKIKAAERRLVTLDTHLAQFEIIKQNKAVYEKYQKVTPNKRNAFYVKCHDEITAYKSAEQYFEKIMNGREKLPIKKWKEERERLTAEKFALCEDYYKLKDDVKNVEALRRSVDNLMREDVRDVPQRTKGIDL